MSTTRGMTGWSFFAPGSASWGLPAPVARIWPAMTVLAARAGGCCRHVCRRLGGLLEQVGDRRHPVAGDVLEDLEHLGPFLQVADAELRIAHRLADQVLARDDQAGEPAAVLALGRRLVLDATAILGLVELLGGQGPQLLVGLVELDLLVADVDRLAVPPAQLLGQPDGVLLGRQDIERVRRRIDSRRGRGDSPRRTSGPAIGWGSMPSDLAEKVPSSSSDSLSWPPPARIRSPLAGFVDRVVDALPLHADSLDAEIVLGPDLEAEELGVEHDLLSGQVFAGEARRLVLAAVDRQGERLLALEAEGVLPAELHLASPLDRGDVGC